MNTIIKITYNYFSNTMKDKKILYFSLIIIWIFILILSGIIGYFQNEIKNIHLNYSQLIEKNNIENTITKHFFEETFEIWDYSQVEYPLTETSHKIIDGIRNVHQSPILVTWSARDLELCAGFIWLLSEELWWKNLPYYIWMMDQKTRTPASAWNLPDAYKHFWWKILADFSKTFDAYSKNLWESVEINEVKSFFLAAFWEEALFWDIWFLYDSTKYVNEILKSGNYNSHITKNMWISKWKKILEINEENISHKDIISQNFSCKPEALNTLFPLLEYYKFTLNGKNILLDWEKFYYVDEKNIKTSEVVFSDLDTLEYSDITLAHFFKWTSHVDSLFQMSCEGKFLPINVISINPRLIEKK